MPTGQTRTDGMPDSEMLCFSDLFLPSPSGLFSFRESIKRTSGLFEPGMGGSRTR